MMKFIDDGNFSSLVRFLLIVFGAGIVSINFVWYRSLLFMSVGLGIAAVGGYASKAHQLGIKPFGSSYQKARDSYEIKDKNQGEEE
ncbi:hypothetical protein [Burkholderia sp. 3C]